MPKYRIKYQIGETSVNKEFKTAEDALNDVFMHSKLLSPDVKYIEYTDGENVEWLDVRELAGKKVEEVVKKLKESKDK